MIGATMKVITKYMEKITPNLFIFIASLCFVSAILSFLTIFLSFTFSWDMSYQGFNNLLIYYKFPIKLFNAFIILTGIWVAVKKYKQADENIANNTAQFNKNREDFNRNFDLHKENIQFNNYLKHNDLYAIHLHEYIHHFRYSNIDLDEDLKENRDIVEEIINRRLTTGFFRHLYRIWFTTDMEHLGNLNKNIESLLSDFAIVVLKHIEENKILNWAYLEGEGISKIIKSLGLTKVAFDFDRNERIANKIILQVCVAICRETLIFANKENEEFDKLYSELCPETNVL